MSSKTREILRYTSFPSRIGPIGLAATAQGLCRLDVNIDRATFGTNLESRYLCQAVEEENVFEDAREMIEGYFRGSVRNFECSLDFIEGTDFQRRVWGALRTIPYGQVRSYAWVAREIGQPKAVRAVGQANGRNPIALIVPCHRVIRNDGHLGGFGAGPEIKSTLLRIEGIHLSSEGKIDAGV